MEALPSVSYTVSVDLLTPAPKLALKQLAQGNLWGWCVVTLFVTLGCVTGECTRGGLSYASESDWKRRCFPDMLADALCQLALHACVND